MEGVADMGGDTRFFGPLPRIDPDEPAFPHVWEGRAFAVTLLANRAFLLGCPLVRVKF